jgi:hypothetical protein
MSESDTPRSSIIERNIMVAIRADNSEQHHAFLEEAFREIASMEEELTTARAEMHKSIEERREESMKAIAARSGLEMWKRCSQKAEQELVTVTEQRDRLADLVKQFVGILDITEESDSGRLFHPTNITSCRAGDLQKIGELVEALRRASRTTDPNEL